MTRKQVLSRRTAKASRISAETHVEIRAAMMRGEKASAIAKRFGVSERTVQVGCNEAILPIFCPICRTNVIPPCLLCFIRNGGDSKSS